MSKKGKESFYEQYGFVQRPNSTMGHGMVIPNFLPNQSLYLVPISRNSNGN